MKKEKTWRIALNSTAHIVEIEEHEGKKSLLEGILVFSTEKNKLWGSLHHVLVFVLFQISKQFHRVTSSKSKLYIAMCGLQIKKNFSVLQRSHRFVMFV